MHALAGNNSEFQYTLPIESIPQANERFGFTLFASICAHAVLILGVGFSVYDKYESSPSLEITLAQYKTDNAPEDANFLAQQNQQGSGSLQEKAAPSSPIQSRFNDESIRDISPFQSRPLSTSSEPNFRVDVLSSTSPADTAILPDQEIDLQDETNQNQDNIMPNPLDSSIASLKAQLDLHREAFANRPRKHTISSASTKESRDALYLDGWRKKIEAIGNVNYPQQATQEGLYGTLRLLVAIRQDGSVDEIRILSSSGHNVLDDAAIRIVRLAGPFEPLPDAMKKDIDILEIIRTWQFHQSNSLTSY